MTEQAGPVTKVVLAATRVKSAAPTAFVELLDALKGLEVQAIQEMAVADGNDIYRAQGKVRALQHLRHHVQSCNELRDTYMKRV